MSVTKIESLEALEKVVKESSKVVVADFGPLGANLVN